jgi:penicillin V acylase-like amidase (Ntn superfamily)
MRRFAALLLAGFCCLWAGRAALACTTFVLQGGDRIYFGRNLDWFWEDGLVLVNPRNVKKTAFVAPEHAAAKWTSKYGSVTFNQMGREMPFGGMNEKGLVVETMWLSDTQYPAGDARPEINMLQWVQFQLDNCSNVAEVIASDKLIRLEKMPIRARIHYLVCDAQGDCATVEFLQGAISVHRGEDLPFHALANDDYEPSATYLRAHPAREGVAEPPIENESLARFCRAAARVSAFKPAKRIFLDVDYAFSTLDQVRDDRTLWQIVYDVSGRRINYRTRSNSQRRSVDLKAFDFACNRPTLSADIQANNASAGEPEFHGLAEADLRKYLQRFFAQESMKQNVGDLTGMVEPLLLTLRGYVCADP